MRRVAAFTDYVLCETLPMRTLPGNRGLMADRHIYDPQSANLWQVLLSTGLRCGVVDPVLVLVTSAPWRRRATTWT